MSEQFLNGTSAHNRPFQCHYMVLRLVIKGMQAVKLCINKILQFLTGGDGKHRLICIMAIKWCCTYLYWDKSISPVPTIVVYQEKLPRLNSKSILWARPACLNFHIQTNTGKTETTNLSRMRLRMTGGKKTENEMLHVIQSATVFNVSIFFR